MTAATRPTVTVAIPVLNEEAHIDACLDAVASQTHGEIIEVLVVDGGSTDTTRDLVALRGGNVRVVDNPRRIQSAALNIALAEARGDVFVRVDGHCVIAPDYVERCVEALRSSGAAMVGGAMNPRAHGWLQEGVAAAMTSPFGVGPARFHRGGPPSWVDTVYLGAYPTELARKVGGYREDVGVNEDAEFAIRMRPHGGVRFDPTIRSTYTPRASLRAVTRQFYRYGRSRAATVRRHPAAVAPRQLVAPLFLVSLATPWRKQAVVAYGAVLAAAAAHQMTRNPKATPGLVLTLPSMHLPWAAGFFRGLVGRSGFSLAPTPLVADPPPETAVA
jgi:glycosyltransferase involved in cell wall biosynthesis